MAIDPLAAPAPVLEHGVVVDGFRLGERLHRGGMATLWAVTRTDGDDTLPLIMKVPRAPVASVGFEVEQMILPTLAGLHVPRFVARGEFAGLPYIVMERVAGVPLSSRLDAAPLAIDEVVRIGCQVAVALHELHRQHVVHLDVRPANVLLRHSGEAVLLDFALARHRRLPDLLEEELDLPADPEQLHLVRGDARSDLFALGVLLYQLLTGTDPFDHAASGRRKRQRLAREPEPPRSLRADCPPWLQEIILRCLEADAGARHPSAAQLAFDLQHPEQVPLTDRARRLSRDGARLRLGRWFAALGNASRAKASARAPVDPGPIVLAAVDVQSAQAALLEAMQLSVQRVVHTVPGARLVCLVVMNTPAAATGPDTLADEERARRRAKLLVQLRHWARPLAQSLEGRRRSNADAHAAPVSYHVLEAADAAAAIIAYARRHQVDHIVVGARKRSALRRSMGSVSDLVAAQSDCTVTIVRAADAAS